MIPFLIAALAGSSSAAAGVALLGAGVSALGQLQAGYAAKTEAEINALNLKNEKEMNKVVAKQRVNQRMADASEALSENIATFVARGRMDRSVEAFLKGQKEKVGKDVRAIQTTGFLQEQADRTAVAAEKARGKAAMTAAMIRGTTTLISGYSNYLDTKV